MEAMNVPVWLVAIAAAAAAPMCVRLYANTVEKRVRERTERLLAEVNAHAAPEANSKIQSPTPRNELGEQSRPSSG
jgi:hypothetical protein